MKKTDIHIIKNRKNFIEIKHKTKDYERDLNWIAWLRSGYFAPSMTDDDNFLPDIQKILKSKEIVDNSKDTLLYLYYVYMTLLNELPDIVSVNFYVEKSLYKDFNTLLKVGTKKWVILKQLMDLA